MPILVIDLMPRGNRTIDRFPYRPVAILDAPGDALGSSKADIAVGIDRPDRLTFPPIDFATTRRN